MADRKTLKGGLNVVKRLLTEEEPASKISKILETNKPPMTAPSGTGLPLMPREQGMYTAREQKDLPRMVGVDKARAEGKQPKYNERMQDLLDSRKARGKVDTLINKGKDLNVQEWYGTEPLRQVAMEAGRSPAQFESLMAQLASASQRNPVDKQNQMGSYLYHLSETGQLPDNALLLTNKLKAALKKDPSLAEGRQLVELPTGYGSLAQGDIFNRAVQIGQGDIAGALPPNKKLGTFYENLLGNLKPVTVDVNALRGPIIEQGDPRWLTSKLVEKDDKGNIINSYKPREMYDTGEMTMREAQQRPGFWEAAPSGSEYAGFEDLWQRGAKRHNIEPAEAQALGWYGSADVTALKTKPENYVDNLERLIKRTAEQTGQSPTKVMNDFVTGKGFLRKDGGSVSKDQEPSALEKIQAKIKSTIHEHHMAAGGGAFKTMKFADGGKAVKTAINLGKRLLESGEEAPKVDRLTMSYRDVTKRVPEVADALEQLIRGDITKQQYNDLVKLYKPVTPYSFVPKPASPEEAIGALRGDTAKSRYGKQAEYEPGSKVGLRLDIPAYTNKGVWVNSIHDQKAKKVAYGATSSVKNAELGISQAQSKKIAQGGEKQPYARVVGEWNPMSDEEAIAKAQEYLNHPEWRQIGLDPERHSYFYDRATMQPITNAEEVIQIGPLVLGKNPKYGNIDDFEYAEGGYATMLPFADGGKVIKGGLNALNRIFKTSDGYTFKELPNGSVTNGDMTWNSVKEFKRDMPDAFQQGDELGQRKASMESVGYGSGSNFLEDWYKYASEPTDDQMYQNLLNRQRAPKPSLRIVPPEKKAGGGLTTSAGSFSPEEVGMTAAEMNAPAIPAYVKQNASKLMDEGRAQLEKEYSQLKTPQGRADFIKRLGTSLVGSPHDMLHWGLEIGDYLQTKIPGMSKPSSVMLPSDTKDRVPKVSLADLHTTKEGDVYGGASGFNTELKKMKFLGDNEYPLMELPVSIFGPSVAIKAGRGLKSMASKAK